MSEGLLPEEEAEEEEAEIQADTAGFAQSLAWEYSQQTPEGLEEAAKFLRDQRKMLNVQLEHLHEQRDLLISRLKARHVGEWLKVAFQGATAFAAICIGAGLLVMLSDAFNSHSVIVEPFDAPAPLAQQGLTGKVVASDLLDALTILQEATRARDSKRRLANAWSGDIKIEVPETGVSIGEIDRLLHERFGHDLHISGDLVADDDKLSLTVRGDGLSPRKFTGPKEDLEKLTTQAAEYIYGNSEPKDFAAYLLEKGRNDDLLTFIQKTWTRAPDSERPELTNSWGSALIGLGKYDDAASKYRLALSLNPRLWKSWNNLVIALQLSGREEDAFRAGLEMETQISKSPKNDRPEGKYLATFEQMKQDWTQALADTLDDAKLNAGAGSARDPQGPIIADNYARLHDWKNADLYLAASDPKDSGTKSEALLISSFHALEDGHAAAAVAPMEEFYKLWLADPDLQSSYLNEPCYLGLAYGLAGRSADAESVFKRVGERAACYAFRADGLEASGDRRAADAAYNLALAKFPDLPIVSLDYGVALLHRGNLRGAERYLAISSNRAPHWADPLKAWGDVLAAENRWAEATAKYNQALKWAPNWDALKEAEARALARKH